MSSEQIPIKTKWEVWKEEHHPADMRIAQCMTCERIVRYPEVLFQYIMDEIGDEIHEEIPYNLEIKTDYIEPSSNNSLKVYQTVWLNKKSYKPIILGKEGKSIKMISVQARLDMQKFLKSKVHLFIRVKMKKSG